MRLDYHAALLVMRGKYAGYRRALLAPEPPRDAEARRLDAAQGIVEALTPETLGLAAVQEALAELTNPLHGAAGDNWRAAIIAFLLARRVPVTPALYRGMLEPAHAGS